MRDYVTLIVFNFSLGALLFGPLTSSRVYAGIGNNFQILLLHLHIRIQIRPGTQICRIYSNSLCLRMWLHLIGVKIVFSFQIFLAEYHGISIHHYIILLVALWENSTMFIIVVRLNGVLLPLMDQNVWGIIRRLRYLSSSCAGRELWRLHRGCWFWFASQCDMTLSGLWWLRKVVHHFTTKIFVRGRDSLDCEFWGNRHIQRHHIDLITGRYSVTLTWFTFAPAKSGLLRLVSTQDSRKALFLNRALTLLLLFIVVLFVDALAIYIIH